MVITNNDITKKNYKKLSIQVSLSGLSFCVFDLITDKIITHNNIIFPKNQVIEEILWKLFVDFPLLSNSYDEIIILHDNNLNTFIPTALFDKNFLGSYLQYNVKVFDTDLFSYDTISNYELHNVFVPYVNINNFLLDQYKSFDYHNSNTILINKLLDYSNSIEDKQVFVHFKEHHFEIIVIKNKQLLFFNSFECNSVDDFIYYLLFTFEQLQLNPEIISVVFLGSIQETDAYYKMAYKYIRNCVFLDVQSKEIIFDQPAAVIRENFILFHS